jgi:hypothetical protein
MVTSSRRVDLFQEEKRHHWALRRKERLKGVRKMDPFQFPRRHLDIVDAQNYLFYKLSEHING